MTRYSDMMCEDIFGCNHAPETPITQDGEIVEWRCRCGKIVYHEPEPAKKEMKEEKK